VYSKKYIKSARNNVGIVETRCLLVKIKGAKGMHVRKRQTMSRYVFIFLLSILPIMSHALPFKDEANEANIASMKDETNETNETNVMDEVDVMLLAGSRYYVEGGGGMEWRRAKTRSLTVSQTPFWPADTDTVTTVSHAPSLLLSGGLLWATQKSWLPYYSAGLEYYYGSTASIKGNVDQFSLPMFQNNYRYGYQVYRHVLRLVGKADLYRWGDVMPYAELGLGAGWNNSGNYAERAAVEVTPRVNPGFGTKVRTNFNYEVGGGLEYEIQKDMWVSLGYRYDWLGKIKTGNGKDTFGESHLYNKLYAHALLVRIRYAFC
jgi:opacity protein-like surface antigen